MGMTGKAMLKLSNLSYQIAGTTILSDIHLQADTGSVIGILGPNGAGKTTLLKLISGQLSSQQQVFWRSNAIENLPAITRAQQIAVVNQFNSRVFNLNLEQIVSMGLLPHQTLFSKVSIAQKDAISTALQQVGLSAKAKQPFHSLSGGEQQRAQIARALVQTAGLFVLDEPINHLDVYYEHQILSLLRKIAKQQNVTIVMSLHDLNHAAEYCDQLCLLAEGKLMSFGSPQEVLTQTRLQQVYKTPCDVVIKPSTHKIRIEFYPPNIEHADVANGRNVIND